MKVKAHFLFLTLAAVGLAGCGSNAVELSAEEQKAFAGNPNGERSEEAKASIADFRRQWEAKHGASGAPSQAGVPGRS